MSWGAAVRSLGVAGLHSTQIVADYVDLDLHTCRCLCRMQPGPTRLISMKLGVNQCIVPRYVVCDIPAHCTDREWLQTSTERYGAVRPVGLRNRRSLQVC